MEDDPFKNHELDPFNHVNVLLREDTDEERINAANFLKEYYQQTGKISTSKGAITFINQIFHVLLDSDMYREAATLNWGYDIMDCRPQIVKEYFDLLCGNNLMCVLGASSVSKCIEKSTPVMMADGTTKPISEVEVGESVMGEDSKPRKVLEIETGTDRLYEVKSINRSWKCTGNHKLVLDFIYQDESTGYLINSRFEPTVEQWLNEWTEEEREVCRQKVCGVRQNEIDRHEKIDIEPCGEGEYVGLLVDQDHKFLLADGTLVHNSYAGVGWLFLDYQRDPDYTAIKLATISSSKLEGLLFSPLKELARQSAMITVGQSLPNFRFTHKPDNINVGFEGILVPQDQKGTGKLKGIKFFKRDRRHPIFENKGRTRIFIDEFQDTSSGIVEDLRSPSMSISDPHSMKIILCGNPTDYALSEAFGQLAEPVRGWNEIDIETDRRWRSIKGYEVLRLDGATCENVIHKHNIVAGMISHEAYSLICADTTSPEYYTFARGMFPIKGGAQSLMNIPLLEGLVGDALFHEGANSLAFVDVGLRNDKAVLSIGKFGMATGRIDPDGERVMFTTGTQDDARQPQLVLQINEIIELTEFDGDVTKLAKLIQKQVMSRNILPKNVGIDTTGMGEGVTSYLANYFGPVLSVHNGESATDVKILMEDKQMPSEVYARVSDELWFAMHKWMSVGAVLISTKIDKTQLFREWATRNIINKKAGNTKQRIETKHEWKARNGGKSPDFADACNGLGFVARHRLGLFPAMEKSGEIQIANRKPFNPPNADYIENLGFNSLTQKKDKPITFDISKTIGSAIGRR